ACEARRYYFGIVGKFGASVQAVLQKAAGLDIAVICPLHGPVLTEDLGYYIEKYDTWSAYRPEDRGVTICYTSVYGTHEGGCGETGRAAGGEGLRERVAVRSRARRYVRGDRGRVPL
ncbi:MAG: hypothetical protein IJU67_02805, partial [Lachnospiraceae bacterium]|nr:hypothetical protein [Lachnospiraceae bacterium]